MPRINYRLEDLRALAALYESGSFSRAADMVHITQSAFSRRIAQLEQAVGGQLVERTTRRVSLTALGQHWAQASAPLIGQLDDCAEEVRRLACGEAGSVVMACLTTVAHAMLPQVLAQFHRSYPQVRVQLRDDTGQRVTRSVVAAEVDFGLGAGSASHPDLISTALCDDPYVIAFRPGHALGRKREVAWNSLAHYQVVGLRATSGNRQQIDEELKAAGIASPWFDEVEHLSSMIGIVHSGVAIAVLPRMALHACDPQRIQTRPLVAPAIKRKLRLLRRREAVLSAPAQALWDMLETALLVPPAHGPQDQPQAARAQQRTSKSRAQKPA